MDYGQSNKFKLLSGLLVLALIAVIIYFLLFHNSCSSFLTKSTFFPDGKSTFIVSNGTFTKTVVVDKTGDVYLFTEEDGTAYNFGVTPPPTTGYEIKTIAGNMFFIKMVDKDDILQYDADTDTLSFVPSKEALSDNTTFMKSGFMFTKPPEDTLTMGPSGKKREGGILKTVAGDVNVCKRECARDAKCIGFNSDGTSCELKTLYFKDMTGDVKTALGPYTDDTTTQYWYKSNTYGNSNTYVGHPNHFVIPGGDDWNQGQTLESCVNELLSPSHASLSDHGIGYNYETKQCLFSDGTVPDPMVFTDALGKNVISMCIDPDADIIDGCK